MAFGYISKAEIVCLGRGLTVGYAKKRSQWFLQACYPEISKMEVLFPRWIARGADCQGGRGEEERVEGGGVIGSSCLDLCSVRCSLDFEGQMSRRLLVH